jgi:hypothetical protein
MAREMQATAIAVLRPDDAAARLVDALKAAVVAYRPKRITLHDRRQGNTEGVIVLEGIARPEAEPLLADVDERWTDTFQILTLGEFRIRQLIAEPLVIAPSSIFGVVADRTRARRTDSCGRVVLGRHHPGGGVPQPRPISGSSGTFVSRVSPLAVCQLIVCGLAELGEPWAMTSTTLPVTSAVS